MLTKIWPESRNRCARGGKNSLIARKWRRLFIGSFRGDKIHDFLIGHSCIWHIRSNLLSLL